MIIETSTSIFPILMCGLYGTELGSYYEECNEEYTEDFRKCVVNTAKDKITEILNNCAYVIGAWDYTLKSPRFYNYENDRIDFTINISYKIVESVKEWVSELKDDKEMLNRIKDEFGSHSGFISFAPADSYEELRKAAYKEATQDKFERAILIYLYYFLLEKVDLEEFQRDFIDNVVEEGNRNGWFYTEE